MNIIVLDDNIHHQLRLESALYDVACFKITIFHKKNNISYHEILL